MIGSRLRAAPFLCPSLSLSFPGAPLQPRPSTAPSSQRAPSPRSTIRTHPSSLTSPLPPPPDGAPPGSTTYPSSPVFPRPFSSGGGPTPKYLLCRSLPVPASPPPPSSRQDSLSEAPPSPAFPGLRLAGTPSSRRGPNPAAPPTPTSPGPASPTPLLPAGPLPKVPPVPPALFLRGPFPPAGITPPNFFPASCPSPSTLPTVKNRLGGMPFDASWSRPGVFGFFPGFFGYFLGFSGRFLKKVGPKTSLFPPLPV